MFLADPATPITTDTANDHRFQFLVGPCDRHRARRPHRVHVLAKRPRSPHLDRIEELRFDSVRAVIAQLYAVERVRCGNVESKQQLAPLTLTRQMHRAMTRRVPSGFVVGHADA
jgi:hypothetical protein